MMRHIAANVLTLMIVALLLLLGIITWGQVQYRASGPLSEALTIEVERGEGLASVTEKLVERNAISNETVFRMAARYTDKDAGLKFGEYEIPASASMEDVLRLLNAGSNVVRQVVVPEGWTSWQVVEMLRGMEDLTGEIAEIPLEGMLAPAGYDFERGDSREAILSRMQVEQERILAEAWAARDPNVPIETPEELLVLASIVEKETGIAEERERVAAVFANRLERGMRLQTDPTVIYGITLGRETLGRGLRASELAAATPFNTYVIAGLPPTPIANPGRDAIDAAANPSDAEDIYFVADGTGGHAFATTLEEHNRNVAAWRRIEAERAAAAEAEADTTETESQ